MKGYYAQKLSSYRLKKCYDLATPRIKQYLAAEIEYVKKLINPDCSVLELGCGYGRILPQLSCNCGNIFGIDNSLLNIKYAKEYLVEYPGIRVAVMDASSLAFPDSSIDFTLVLQNGVSSFHMNVYDLFKECIRITKSNGKVLFSSYSNKIWDFRLEWFRLQSEAGLLGEIDFNKTGNGVIVCQDGFTATTFKPEDFEAIADQFKPTVDYCIEEIDNSSVFCVLKVLQS